MGSLSKFASIPNGVRKMCFQRQNKYSIYRYRYRYRYRAITVPKDLHRNLAAMYTSKNVVTKSRFMSTQSNTLTTDSSPMFKQRFTTEGNSLFDHFQFLLTALLAAFAAYLTLDRKTIFGSVYAAAFGFGPAVHNFIADIVDKAGPAVVFIEVKQSHPVSGRRVTMSNGSGFLVRKNGLVLTNAHVVENQSVVNVQLHDGSTFKGIVTAIDPVCDLATIKIDAGNKALSVIPLGKASTIRPGEFVAAMGSPLSLHRTTTVGIVSNPLRTSSELGLPKSDMQYIQTDAVFGLGNCGGPLVNLDGKAIGINTLKLADGICFAIPTDYAQKLIDHADSLAHKAEVEKRPNYLPNGQETNRRRYVGITMLPLTPAISLELQEKNKEFPPNIVSGVYVYKVVVSSPAYVGGLHAGDVIVEINGEPIASSADIYRMVEKQDKLTFKVLRGKHYGKYTVVTEAI